ncbi:MAG: phage tail tube protein [Proteobacteria bacterium]|nr:phage tail tube protein [Pseudomonadota bacterium]
MQLTGKAIIRVDGQELRTDPGATLNPGGVKRNPIPDSRGQTHYNEENVSPELECKLHHGADISLKAMNDITGATVIFECDTGAQFILREAFTLEPLTLDSKEGRAPLKMSALTCEEV